MVTVLVYGASVAADGCRHQTVNTPSLGNRDPFLFCQLSILTPSSSRYSRSSFPGSLWIPSPSFRQEESHPPLLALDPPSPVIMKRLLLPSRLWASLPHQPWILTSLLATADPSFPVSCVSSLSLCQKQILRAFFPYQLWIFPFPWIYSGPFLLTVTRSPSFYPQVAKPSSPS